LITQHVADFFGYPVLHIWSGGEKDDAKGQRVSCGVMACEIEEKYVAIDLLFSQATLLGSQERTFFLHRVCICCFCHLLGSTDKRRHQVVAA
jgi:hypothetical protein